MMSTSRKLGLVVAAAVLLAFAPLAEAITIIDLGTGAPPAVVGGWVMTPFGDDGRAVLLNVTDVASPLGGAVGFSIPVNHREIGSSWATWSHGYTGDVYYSNGSETLTMTLPAGTAAFYFYAEPNPFGFFDITATANDGSSITISINGNSGANGFGIFGAGLTSITVDGDVDFAVGEFGIAKVPEPSTVLLLGAGLAALGLRRFRRS